MDPWSILFVLLSPTLLPVSILFPFYWVGGCDLLRKTGSWRLHDEHHDRWMRRMGKAAVAGVVLTLLAFVIPGVMPRVASFVGAGGTLLAAVPILLDLGLLMCCSPDRAYEQWQARQHD